MNRHFGNSANEAAAEGRVSNVVSNMAMAAGALGQPSTFRRFLVEEVVFDPTELDDDRLNAMREKYALGDATFLKQMPPNTVIARAVNQSGFGHERYHYLFPFLPPHVMLPVQAGEHVWAFFEQDKAIDHGFWLWRISEPRHVDDVNHTHADRKYHVSERSRTAKDKFDGTTSGVPGFENGPTFVRDSDTQTAAGSASTPDADPKAYEKLLKETDSARVTDMEPVPRFRKRPGDHVIQGSNNAMIVLGTDRTGRTAKFKKGERGKVAEGKPAGDQNEGAGTIDMVVGRGQTDKTSGKKIENTLKKTETSKRVTDEKITEGDPDFANDLGRLYLSMKTDPDGNMEINFSDRVGSGVPAGVVKTDHLRIVVRKTLKMLIQPEPGAPEGDCAGVVIKNGDVIFIPSANGFVKLGSEKASKAILTQPVGATGEGGTVVAPPMTSTLGSQHGIGGTNGEYAKKVLVE